MSAVSRHDVIAAYDRTVSLLRLYIDGAEPDVLAHLVGHDPALRGLRDAFERATAPAACEHVRGPHGTEQEAGCVLTRGHAGGHRYLDAGGEP